ncbi:hypothetical protein JXJ21_08575 [candidate division KSB1 bacterium]|nr:hypothetical protein [candidate division KSB1 bacterium]
MFIQLELFIGFMMLALFFMTACIAQERWAVLFDEQEAQDEAIKVAFADLQEAGQQFGVCFEMVASPAEASDNLLLVGNPTTNEYLKIFIREHGISLPAVTHPEGHAILTYHAGGKKTVIVSGSSIPGNVYGIFWLCDRLRVLKGLPEINTLREPSLDIRYTRIFVKNRADIQRALRYGLNLIYIQSTLGLVPWNSEPENTENARNREQARELIDYAHALHLKCLVMGTEFTYHPSILEEFNATLSPADPCFWDAMQAKFRRLFQELPELDGVVAFTGPEQHFWGNYRAFDVMHDDKSCEWTLEKRYRTFIKKVQHVVVGEFDKIYHHRTWMTNCYEQQARPEVYREIFTDDVPTKNLFLIPSFTQNDRWWHQRYNPTFNLTPHKMLTVMEPMNYYESSNANLFPTFPGQYYQAGLQMVLESEKCNLKGASFDLHPKEDFRTPTVTAYTGFRLGWNHLESPETIAEEFCRIYFGEAAAKGMAEIYLMSPVAYKYGLFIEPVAYGDFNSLPHIRVGTFPAQGYPRIDNGKEHIRFWREIYLRCKPWLTETYDDLDHGLEVANEMCEKFKTVKALIADEQLAQTVENSLNMTRRLIQTNNSYTRAAFAYFAYTDAPDEANKTDLAARFKTLQQARSAFTGTRGFGYQLFGVDQLIENIKAALDDLPRAMQVLKHAPDREKIEQTIALQQEKYREVLANYPKEAIKFLHWEGLIDGRDILKVSGNQAEIIHLRWDPPEVKACTFFEPLPAQKLTVIPKDIQSRPMHPFIIEQPSSENGYAVQVYLYDAPEGRDWFKFDLYYILKSPEELHLELPW